MPDTTSPSAAPHREPDLTGRQLGDYRILRKLGQGGMAVVYLAEQMSLKRQVAFKVLRSSLAGDAKYVQRFHHEAQAAAKLVHPNIVQTYHVDCIDGVHFIAQEYVPGQNLRQLLRRQRGMEVPQAVHVMAQVAFALQAAAEHGVVHRDIKPENTLITPRGVVKVADFGLARVTIEGRQVELTQLGVTMGTPLYMSPEQIEGKPVDPRSDLYSLGVMAYQMLAGQPPFEADSPLALAVRHLHDAPTPLSEIRKDLPAELCEFVQRLLAKQPDQRFASPTALLVELKQLRIEGMEDLWSNSWAALIPEVHQPVEATQRLESAMLSQTQLLRVRRRRRWSTVALAVAACFVVGAVAAKLLQPAPLLPVHLSQTTSVAKQPTVREQFYHALEENTPGAYRAVAQYFPPSESPLNEHYARLGQRYLAEYYLESGQLDQAQREFGKLAALGDESPQFTVIGLFGQAIVFDRQQKTLTATSRLTQATRWWQKVPEDQRRPLLGMLPGKLSTIFLDLLEDRESPEPAPGSETSHLRPFDRLGSRFPAG